MSHLRSSHTNRFSSGNAVPDALVAKHTALWWYPSMVSAIWRLISMMAAPFFIIARRAWFEETDLCHASHAGVYCVKLRPSDMRGGAIPIVSNLPKRLKPDRRMTSSHLFAPWSPTLGWGLVISGVLGACAILILIMMPSGWQKVNAQVVKVDPLGSHTDAHVTYAFGARQMSGQVSLANDTYTGDIVTIEYDAFDPTKIRPASWSKQAAVFYGLPLMWTTMLTGATIIANLPK